MIINGRANVTWRVCVCVLSIRQLDWIWARPAYLCYFAPSSGIWISLTFESTFLFRSAVGKFHEQRIFSARQQSAVENLDNLLALFAWFHTCETNAFIYIWNIVRTVFIWKLARAINRKLTARYIIFEHCFQRTCSYVRTVPRSHKAKAIDRKRLSGTWHTFLCGGLNHQSHTLKLTENSKQKKNQTATNIFV